MSGTGADGACERLSFNDLDVAETYTLQLGATGESVTVLGATSVTHTATYGYFTAVGDSDGSITWSYELTSDELDANEAASESVTLTVRDDEGVTHTQTLNVNLTGAEDAHT